MNKDLQPDRIERAYHEAGHAVVTYRLGFELSATTIQPKGSTLGASGGEAVWADGTRDSDYVVALYAGFAAQRRYHPSADPRGSARDYEEAADLLRGLKETERELRARADQLVDQYWNEIEAVATALIEETTLTGEETDLICDAVAEGEDWRGILEEYRRRWG